MAVALRSSVRLLVSGSSTLTSELLWLASSVVRDKETLVVRNEQFLDLSLAGLVEVFLVVSDQSSGNGLSHGHDLGHGTGSLDSYSNAEILESVTTGDKDWLEDFHSHGLWLDELEWLSIDSNDAFALSVSTFALLGTLNEGDGRSVFLFTEGSNLLNSTVTHYFSL